MNIGFDIDGFITPFTLYKGKRSLPEPLILAGIIIVDALIPPRKSVVAALRRWKKEGDILHAFSLRPERARFLTMVLFSSNKIPYDYIHLLGVGEGGLQRKLETIKKVGIQCYFDDDSNTVAFLRDNGVRAYQFGASRL